MSIIQVFTLLGGLGMFLYGMTLMSEGLQKSAGEKLRLFLATMTSTPLKRVLTGLGITAIIQSSSATTVMVVSFVNAGLLSLANAIGVIMGANIGTTITAWLISILGFKVDIAAISVPLMAVGFLLSISKKNKNKNIGPLIIGFSLLFLGLKYLKDAVPDLGANPQALVFLQQWAGYGFGSVLIFLAIGTIMTIVLQSSSATMALTLVMVNFGWIDFQMAAAMVLGENLGTTITANLAASVANVSAKRAARAHTIFNVFGIIWVLVLYRPFLKLISLIVTSMGYMDPIGLDLNDCPAENKEIAESSVLYGVSMLHTVFNVINTVILMWFIPYIEKVVTILVKQPKGEDEVFRLQYIQGGPLSTAELSLDEAKQEIDHFANVCYNGFKYAKQAINEKDPEQVDILIQKLVKYEEITDRMELEIATYLNDVSKGEISDSSAARIKGMYKVISEMESLGDVGESISRILKRMVIHKKYFSDDMLKKLNLMIDLVDKSYDVMIDNLKKSYSEFTDLNAAQDAEYQINLNRNYIKEEHITNIKRDNYDYHTGVYYIDLVSELEKLGDYIINVSEAIANVK